MGAAVRLTRSTFGIAVLLAGALQVSAGPASAEGGVFSGACVVRLDVTFSSPLGALPSAGTHGFSGGGTCVVNGEVSELEFSGSFSANPTTGFGCVAGVAHGDARFSVDLAGFPNPVVQLLLVNHGGVVNVTAFKLVTSFEGQGVLLQAPNTTTACATGTPALSATWDGAVAFQDPDPAPIG